MYWVASNETSVVNVNTYFQFVNWKGRPVAAAAEHDVDNAPDIPDHSEAQTKNTRPLQGRTHKQPAMPKTKTEPKEKAKVTTQAKKDDTLAGTEFSSL